MIEAQQIKEHMEVCGSDGAHVGTVDCTQDANKIVLTKSDGGLGRRADRRVYSDARKRPARGLQKRHRVIRLFDDGRLRK